MKTTVDSRIGVGMRFGAWMVLDEMICTDNGQRKWLCQCDCGTRRYVLERTLLYHESSSCGCVNRAKARMRSEHDLLGRRFGDLTVLYKAEKQHRYGGTWWVCACSCGKTIETPGTLLVTGRKTHCGCKTVKNYHYQDVTGQRFGRLTAMHPLPDRDAKGNVMWHCRCDCGNEIDVSYNWLMYSGMRSCGCRKREHDAVLGQMLAHVDGTSVDMIRSKKVPADNTTGVRGVYAVHGKWLAKIVFQKKQYHLGVFDTIEEASAARKAAEALLFDGVVDHYERWKSKADVDPAWAQDNPICVSVEKGPSGGLRVLCLPVMDE